MENFLNTFESENSNMSENSWQLALTKFEHTSGKLLLKMRRMSIISSVLHIIVSNLRLKHRMRLIQRALDSPGLVDYFSYPHHG